VTVGPPLLAIHRVKRQQFVLRSELLCRAGKFVKQNFYDLLTATEICAELRLPGQENILMREA